MKKNMFIKDKRAVSVPLDFMIAFSILIVGIFLLIYTINSIFIIYDNPEPNLNSKAAEISNLLITSPGYMDNGGSDWENERFPADKIVNLGFSKDNESFGLLSIKKINSFKSNVSMENYSQIRDILGLTTEEEWYDFNITIYDINNGSYLLSYGRNYENEEFSGSFQRHVLIENYDHNVKIRVTIS